MILINTNAKKDTKKLVGAVTELKKNNPADFNETMNTIRDVTSEIIEILQEEVVDKFAFLDYVTQNQQYLQELGVSSPEIDDVISTMMLHEVHGKLTGAGGGGCVIGFPKDPKELFKESNQTETEDCALYRELESKGFTVLKNIAKSKEGYTIVFDGQAIAHL